MNVETGQKREGVKQNTSTMHDIFIIWERARLTIDASVFPQRGTRLMQSSNILEFFDVCMSANGALKGYGHACFVSCIL